MATSFPAAFDATTKPDATTVMNDPGFEGDVVISNIIDSILAAQIKIGITNSLDTTSLDYLIKQAHRPGLTLNLADITDVTATATEISKLHGITEGTASASKFLLVDASKNLDMVTGSLTNTTTTSTNITLQNSGNLTLGNSTTIKGRDDGWRLAADTWVYLSTTSVRISNVDRSDLYEIGDKIRFKQGGSYVQGYIIAVTFSTHTDLTVVLGYSGGSQIVVANSGITDNYYSKTLTPDGFPQWFDNSPGSSSITGLTGWASVTSNLQRFCIIGRTVFFNGLIDGTSNAVTAKVSLPVAAATLSTMIWGAAALYSVDNGSVLTTPSGANIVSAGTTLDFYKTLDPAGSAWTNANQKQVRWSITYQI